VAVVSPQTTNWVVSLSFSNHWFLGGAAAFWAWPITLESPNEWHLSWLYSTFTWMRLALCGQSTGVWRQSSLIAYHGRSRPWTHMFLGNTESRECPLKDSDGLTRGRCTAYSTATPITITCILTIVLFMISSYRWRPSKLSEKNWDDYHVTSSQSLGATSYYHQKFEDGSSSSFEAIRLL
jgi:hypothetical protein